MVRFSILIIFAIVLPGGMTIASAQSGAPRLGIEVETGAIWQSRNDVQIPNTEDGTRFSLPDVIGNGPWWSSRFYVTWAINDRHRVRALAAPLSITANGTLADAITFEGGHFAVGLPTEATYQFNSWRLTYQYQFARNDNWDWRVGFTAKIRDAKVELRQDENVATKTDVGFVPLLHVHVERRLNERWKTVLDLDALAGGPGRAEDGSLKLSARIGQRSSLAIGYRTVEGGADVDEVYNFAWLHYAVISFTHEIW